MGDISVEDLAPRAEHVRVLFFLGGFEVAVYTLGLHGFGFSHTTLLPRRACFFCDSPVSRLIPTRAHMVPLLTVIYGISGDEL